MRTIFKASQSQTHVVASRARKPERWRRHATRRGWTAASPIGVHHLVPTLHRQPQASTHTTAKGGALGQNIQGHGHPSQPKNYEKNNGGARPGAMKY